MGAYRACDECRSRCPYAARGSTFAPTATLFRILGDAGQQPLVGRGVCLSVCPGSLQNPPQHVEREEGVGPKGIRAKMAFDAPPLFRPHPIPSRPIITKS